MEANRRRRNFRSKQIVLGQLEPWNHEFESSSGHGCMYAFFCLWSYRYCGGCSPIERNVLNVWLT